MAEQKGETFDAVFHAARRMTYVSAPDDEDYEPERQNSTVSQDDSEWADAKSDQDFEAIKSEPRDEYTVEVSLRDEYHYVCEAPHNSGQQQEYAQRRMTAQEPQLGKICKSGHCQYLTICQRNLSECHPTEFPRPECIESRGKD